MRPRTSRIFMGDFETSVYEGQTETEVWASALVELGTEDVMVFGSIESTYTYLRQLPDNIIVYYHNLKFDGAFILSYLLTELHYEQAYDIIDEERFSVQWHDDKDLRNNQVKYAISAMGQWYSITVKTHNKIIEFRDSLKLLPFKVAEIGKSFKTKHQKLTMEYKGERHANCYISPEELEYIKNDVFVVKEALEIMFDEGHDKLTIGSCCLNEFRKTQMKEDYKNWFPNLYELPLDKEEYGSETIGDYIHRSYHGGWCYVVKGKENQRKHNGITLDVNSLYPSMMSSESGNKYPIGKPKFWKGNFIPPEAEGQNKFYFVRIQTRFKIKEGMLPFIQLKRDLRYDPTEMQITSDVLWNGEYYKYTQKKDGTLVDTIQTLTLTMMDYELLKKHYELYDFEILDGCYFYAMEGLFDEYIEKYKKQKLTSKGAKRQLAKLFLNNLYGKMAANTNSSFKVAYVKDDGSLGFHVVFANDKKPGYIPIGSAITSYARCFTISAAQLNYHGVDECGFIYADTDSIHCDLPVEQIKGVKLDDNNFCCWKAEANWDDAIFTRQKTYIEHVIAENLEPIEQPYYNIKCAGMPEKCKVLFNISLDGYDATKEYDFTDEELEFIKEKRELEDFNIGLKVPGKLLPKRIKGGIVLVDTPYELRA